MGRKALCANANRVKPLACVQAVGHPCHHLPLHHKAVERGTALRPSVQLSHTAATQPNTHNTYAPNNVQSVPTRLPPTCTSCPKPPPLVIHLSPARSPAPPPPAPAAPAPPAPPRLPPLAPRCGGPAPGSWRPGPPTAPRRRGTGAVQPMAHKGTHGCRGVVAWTWVRRMSLYVSSSCSCTHGDTRVRECQDTCVDTQCIAQFCVSGDTGVHGV